MINFDHIVHIILQTMDMTSFRTYFQLFGWKVSNEYMICFHGIWAEFNSIWNSMYCSRVLEFICSFDWQYINTQFSLNDQCVGVDHCYSIHVYRCISIYSRVARFSTFFSDRLGTYGKSCVPMPIKEPYNLFDLGWYLPQPQWL